MALTLIATPGSASANAYCDADYADAYFESRVDLPTVQWADLDASDKDKLLVMATRVLDATMRGQKTLVPQSGSKDAFYLIKRSWTGAPATTTQRLAWPRTGMYDQNGNAISASVVPSDLKDAVCELAGQLAQKDRTLDSDVYVQGIKGVKAGSVSVNFRDGAILPQVLPDGAVSLLVPSWYTEEQLDSTSNFEFEVYSNDTTV